MAETTDTAHPFDSGHVTAEKQRTAARHVNVNTVR